MVDWLHGYALGPVPGADVPERLHTMAEVSLLTLLAGVRIRASNSAVDIVQEDGYQLELEHMLCVKQIDWIMAQLAEAKIGAYSTVCVAIHKRVGNILLR